MRCERCWSDDGEPVEGPEGGTVPLCAPCRRRAPEDSVLFHRLFLRFATRKEFLRRHATSDAEEALQRWAEEEGLGPREARRRVLAEEGRMGLFPRAVRRPRPPRTAPYGYRHGREGLVPHGYEAEVVRRIFRRCLRGESLQSIADTLNRERVPTRRTRRWHPSTLRFLLRNPLYAGYERRVGFVRRGSHRPLVREVDFREAQRRLAERCRRPSQKASRGATV